MDCFQLLSLILVFVTKQARSQTTLSPTRTPTASPTSRPSVPPTFEPTLEPTLEPTVMEYPYSCGRFVGATTEEYDINYYNFTVESSIDLTLDVCNATYDTWLYFYTADRELIESCDDCGDCGVQTILEIDNVEPGNYLIGIGGWSNRFGSYTIEAYCNTASPTTSPTTAAPTTPPTTAEPTSQTENPTTAAPTTAYPTTAPTYSCGTFSGETTEQYDINWYNYTVYETTDLVMDVCDADYDTWLYLSTADGQNIANCDDCGDCGVQTVLEVDDLAPGDYLIGIGGFSRNFGSYTIEVFCGYDIETVRECEDDEIATFDWDILTEEGVGVPEYDVTQFYVDESDLSLNIKVELEYLGKASADDEDEANFGVTYVLDFEDFDAHTNAINEPGTCQNRDESAFNGSSFSDYWEYSNDPIDDIGSVEYLAYPPPDPVSGSWEVYMKDGEQCSTVIYEGKFTWNELRGCEPNGGGDSYTSVVSDDKWLNLTGTFYINVVSPFWYNQDFGYYRVYQLLSQPFVIAVSSTVYVLGSTGINLMTLSVVAVYKEDDAADFKLILMTETADYMMLERSDTSIFLFNPSDNNDNNFNNTNFMASTDPENSEGCLTNKDFICTQLWEIEASNIGCIKGEGGEGTDFSGTYSLGFNAVCLDDSNTSYCYQWIEDHPDLQGEISLSTELFWKDDICDPEVFTVQFVANMIFYSGPLSEERTDGSDEYQVVAASNVLYQVGEDRIYVEIDTEFPSDTLEIFNTKLINVWICTFAPDISPSIDMDNLLSSGCLSSSRDSEYDVSFYNIYYSGDSENAQSGFTVDNDNEDDETDIVRFSFDVPNEVARDTLYVHAQIEVELTELEQPELPTRRMLLNVGVDPGANQIQHFGEEIGIGHGTNKHRESPNEKQPNNHYEYPPQQQPQPQPQLPLSGPSLWTIDLSSPWVVVIGGMLILILTVNMIFMCYKNCHSVERGVGFIENRVRRNRGYSGVKTVDSEYDDSQSDNSVVPMIN